MIERIRFQHHEELRVWVQAQNQHGSVKSPEVVLNPAHMSESYSTMSHGIFIMFGATSFRHLKSRRIKENWLNSLKLFSKIMNHNRFCCPWLLSRTAASSHHRTEPRWGIWDSLEFCLQKSCLVHWNVQCPISDWGGTKLAWGFFVFCFPSKLSQTHTAK